MGCLALDGLVINHPNYGGVVKIKSPEKDCVVPSKCCGNTIIILFIHCPLDLLLDELYSSPFWGCKIENLLLSGYGP